MLTKSNVGGGCAFLFLFIFFIFFGLASIAMIFFYYRAYQTYTWEPAEARIELLKLDKEKATREYTSSDKYGKKKTEYTTYYQDVLRLSYSYQLNDTLYHGKELWEGDGDGSTGKTAKRIYEKLRSAQVIRLWVNPKAPADEAYSVRGITQELVSVHILFIFFTKAFHFFLYGKLESPPNSSFLKKYFGWIFWTAFLIVGFIIQENGLPMLTKTVDKIEILEERLVPLPEEKTNYD